ncbi:NAD(P)-binding protein [Trichodelitschia bisporula]|uniref:NAD(P)-binding protein n=1 Tax=Trichodelitschia bisporula TaxID=703511 RepID=A0A6G1HTU9_9PEZI|nr:NAD(P)-binding protein [Trichodelitschia bisporula]
MAETSELDAAKLFSVEDYVCVVTGGGTGIGLMCAQALAANGARVYITSRRADVLSQAAEAHTPRGKGRIIAARPCDVTKKEDLEALAASIKEAEGHVDVLVTAAGIQGPRGNPEGEETNEGMGEGGDGGLEDAATMVKGLWEAEGFEGWSKAYTTDVAAIYFTTLAFLPLLQAGTRKRGPLTASVVTISSMSGLMRHAQAHFAYNAAKGGAVHLSKMMSSEFQRVGVRVNSIAPGYFPSEMTTGVSEKGKSHMDNEKVQSKGHVPIGRPGKDAEMAMACLFLVKDGYVNGQVVTVDGGVMNVIAG